MDLHGIPVIGTNVARTEARLIPEQPPGSLLGAHCAEPFFPSAGFGRFIWAATLDGPLFSSRPVIYDNYCNDEMSKHHVVPYSYSIIRYTVLCYPKATPAEAKVRWARWG